MRIAFVVTTLAPGGAERQALLLAEGMRARGHEVEMLVLRRRAERVLATSLSPCFAGMEKSPLALLAGFWRARRHLRRFEPDVIHSHTFPANFAARLLRMSGVRAPVVHSIHNVYEGGSARMLAYRLTDGWSRLSVAVCNAAARRFVQLGAVSAEKCRVVANGIETASYVPDATRRQQSRAAMSAGMMFVWLAVGRIAPAKDYTNLLRAYALHCQEHANSALWIAGAGSTEELEREAIELGVRDRVLWLGHREDVRELLDAADGFVMSSAWEGMPLAVAEAMAMEKPVVATAVGGVPELVADEGILTPAHDSARLAEAMCAVQSVSAEDRAAMGRKARARVLEQFDVERMLRAWEAIYGEVMQRR